MSVNKKNVIKRNKTVISREVLVLLTIKLKEKRGPGFVNRL